MPKKAIVTGHTRGLGAALAAQLEADGWDVLGVARSGGERVDLGDPEALLAWLDGGTLRAHLADADEILLINNAGYLGPSNLVGDQDPAQAALAVNVNLTAPILLTNAVLRDRPAGTPTRVAHISSGVGRRPIPGWSVYGATKAAVDHHARTVSAEGHDGVRIVSIRPGVVDTEMQGEIRESAGFPLRADFVAMKEEGRLVSAADAARAVLAIVDADDFGAEPLASV
ncbi:MAG: SDR family NAD(P)-dependent oxidoreductase [Tessaracoccus sp.]|uniref:SDR family NAD(P)-dependent oxidoreductase n=1 Tax=Tessaracoccus sp. TaxID=1971211 RepID=UPI001EBDFCE0|nr:SDR family NAD(P)-dependent oxidoreductase [Tessaracoccus sp.]MBK7820201.1 SDR family NAD(P)-dependent oxidoreductase [Tessaracoccus sp.]